MILSAPEWISLFAGGAIALIASITTGFFQHWLKSGGELQIYKRDKLERFVTLLNKLHHLGLSPDTASEIEQQRQWLEYMTEMTVITQLYLPELQHAHVLAANCSREFAMAGQRLFASAEQRGTPADEAEHLNREYRIEQTVSQKAWEFAMDQAQALSHRMGLTGKFVPLPGDAPLLEEPEKESLAKPENI